MTEEKSIPDSPVGDHERGEAFSTFDLRVLPKGDAYKLLASTVIPRPIAWVVTRDSSGALNAAPFSFFNVLSSDPPLIAVAFSAAPDREGKDSLHHIRERGEFVVNLVPEELAEAMNITASNAPRGTDETKVAGLTVLPSTQVDVPRIAESPVALECRLWQAIETEGSTTVVMAKVVAMHVLTEAFTSRERLHLDSAKLRLIGRMESPNGYCRTRDVFHLERKSWPL